MVTTILLICFIVRKRKTNQTRRDLLDKARAKLSELKDQSASLKPEMNATRISVILRQYLEAAFEDPALFETNEEFTLRPTALERIHPDVRPQILAFRLKTRDFGRKIAMQICVGSQNPNVR